MKLTASKLLAGYSAVLTAAFAYGLIAHASAKPERAAFDEIDVKRINIRENDGTLRMVISSRDRFPGWINKGVEHGHDARREAAGMLFYNDEGTENGGLTFNGKKVDGKIVAGGSLTFDQYEQDQVVNLFQGEENGEKTAGLEIDDRPGNPLGLDLIGRIRATPPGPARQALIEQAGGGYKHRLLIGKSADRASRIALKDAQGHSRLVLRVEADGRAAVDFLDDKGKVVRSVAP